MKNYIIHIGLPKTGSSFLQEMVFPRFEGISYHSNVALRSYVEFNHLQLADDSLYDAKKTQKLIDQFEGEKILLSDERFGGRFLGFGGAINRSITAKRLKQHMPNAKIIVFLRGQTSAIYSSYSQYVKGFAKGIKPFQKFVHQPERYLESNMGAPFYDSVSLGLTPHYWCYYELLTLYTSLFDEVKILLFEDLVEDPESVLAEIETFIEADNSLLGKIDWKKKLNTSLKGEDIHTLRYANAVSIFGHPLLAKVFRKLMHVLNYRITRPAISDREAAENLAPIFHSNNQKVIEHFPLAGIQRYPEKYPVQNT